MTSIDIDGAHPYLRNLGANKPTFINKIDDIDGARPKHKIDALRKNAARMKSYDLHNPGVDLKQEAFKEFSFVE